jgi:hypothetical protein
MSTCNTEFLLTVSQDTREKIKRIRFPFRWASFFAAFAYHIHPLFPFFILIHSISHSLLAPPVFVTVTMYRRDGDWSVAENVAYISLSRVSWSFGVAIVMYASKHQICVCRDRRISAAEP